MNAVFVIYICTTQTTLLIYILERVYYIVKNFRIQLSLNDQPLIQRIKGAKSKLDGSSDLLINNLNDASSDPDNLPQVEKVSFKVNNIYVISGINATVVKLGEASFGKNYQTSNQTQSTDMQEVNCSCTFDFKKPDKTHSTAESCYFDLTTKDYFETKTTWRTTPKLIPLTVKHQPTMVPCTEKTTCLVKTTCTVKTTCMVKTTTINKTMCTDKATKVTCRCPAKSSTESNVGL